MITSIDLFGRSTLTSKEKKELLAANKTAQEINNNPEHPVRCHLENDTPSLYEIEQIIIRSLQLRDKFH